MPGRKVHKTFFHTADGGKQPINVEYRLRLPQHIMFGVPGDWIVWELKEIRVDCVEEETTYYLGAFLGLAKIREKNTHYNEGEG